MPSPIIQRPSVTMQSVIKLSVIRLNGKMLMLSVIMPSAIIQRPSVTMQSVVKLSVVAPPKVVKISMAAEITNFFCKHSTLLGYFYCFLVFSLFCGR